MVTTHFSSLFTTTILALQPVFRTLLDLLDLLPALAPDSLELRSEWQANSYRLYCFVIWLLLQLEIFVMKPHFLA
ncbi:Os05g0317400 [Oryza sativa Japonica Group]|uniref:Os05g0317400 protein n=2 Tax=Oryza sativa subsp. japonica TaxID=39947 RepID=C7J339_ORYSJ|nr:unknown protein [Oryza sativa Japonica Group]KAB8098885.1 hypothetical protein EE612_028618 [Oryza sativa]BAH93072.1 Os05g0317400 [Oryza sativa Japonica Group]BAS93334.1 Os05g0317400 [Oryza sativa Japonica Group]|eukprot:NP_001174344.1 Os05g0317400 [Oryza sativa Japonica Group]